jgi:hypothetical protein
MLLASAASLAASKADAGFSMFQLGNSPGAAAIQSQFLPIGGIGLSRILFMANDGTMYVGNDTGGNWKGNTSNFPGTGPGLGNYQWTGMFNSTNIPSSLMPSPTPYAQWNPAIYSLASLAGNSNLIYMMTSAYQGSNSNFGYLVKSTDGGATWTLTGYPFNKNNGNGPGADNPAVGSQTICIDPNNNNIVWCSDGAQLRVSSDGGSTWAAVNPSGVANPAYAMAYDPNTANRLLVGIVGSGVYVTTNANLTTSATFSLVSGTAGISPGIAHFASDSNYYLSDSSNGGVLYRITPGNVFSTIYNSTSFFGWHVDPNNPARIALCKGSPGSLTINSTAVNSGTPSWAAGPSTVTISDADAPTVYFFAANAQTTNQIAFDPWTTTSSTSINLSGLASGGATGTITVPAGIPNITVGRQLRCSNTGTPANYFIFTVGSYSGTSLSGTIIGSATGGYLGGPIGGTGTFSAWTISAERIYACGDGVGYIDGFSSSAQTFTTTKFGLEGSYIADVRWPVGGNPAMTTQDRHVFQVPTNPWQASIGVVPGYGPTSGVSQITYLNYSITDPTFWIVSASPGTYFSTGSAKAGTWTKYTNQPVSNGNNAGPVAIAASDFAIVADKANGLFYSQNATSLGATWTLVPSPAPTSGWAFGGQFNMCATGCVDRTTTTAPYLFYFMNSDGHVYKISVPTSGSPTVTKGTNQVGTTTQFGGIPGAKLDSVPGNAGHLFYCAGNLYSGTTYANLLADHPAGGQYRLAFSSDGGNNWTYLTTTQEVLVFSSQGAAVPGGSGYPALYACGWCGGGGYGIYQCINFNPASLGSETWTKIGTFAGAFDLVMPISMAADPNQYNRLIIGSNGGGAAILESPNLANSWYP